MKLVCEKYFSKYAIQEKRLNTTKKVVAITTNVIVIGVIVTTKKSMQGVVINSEAIGLCNTKFSLQWISHIATICFENLIAIGWFFY